MMKSMQNSHKQTKMVKMLYHNKRTSQLIYTHTHIFLMCTSSKKNLLSSNVVFLVKIHILH